MAQQTIDPNQLTDTELKALAFDLVCQIEGDTRTLNVIRNVLASRVKPEENEPTKDVT
jgi:hypothetical protein